MNAGKEEERLSLLDSCILHMHIGIEPLQGNTFQRFFRNILGTNFHYSCFLKLSSDPYEGIILEYGAYFGTQDSSYKNYIHYGEGKEDGIRFSKMSFKDYEKKIHNGLKGSQIIGNFIVINNKMTLGRLFEECISKSEKNWGSSDYNISSHNSETFILKVIELLKVTRDAKEPYVFRYYIRHAIFPPEILKALEDNESEEVKSNNEAKPPLLKRLFFS